MMINLKKYNPSDVYMTPSGALMDGATVAEKYPASAHFVHVVQTDPSGEVMYGLYNLAAMRANYGIDSTLGVDAAILALQAAMAAEQDAQTAAAQEPNAEERIAAAMEYQNLMNL